MKIVIGLDGSAPSLVGRDLVASLPWPAETSVRLVGAYQVPIDWSGAFGGTMNWAGEVADAMRDELDDQLRAATEPLIAARLIVEQVTRPGRAADVLIDAAREFEADLLVVGSRGLGGLRSMLLGSVASDVAAHAPCPVLVARSPKVERLLVATDGSTGADQIVERLGAWGSFAGIPSDVVAVAFPDNPAFELMVGLYTLGDDRLEQGRAALESKAEIDARSMAERLAAIGIPAEAHPRRGDPAAEIVMHAEEIGADLVAIGSRGLTGLDGLLLGSVARNVLSNAHCSVLIVRREA